MDYHLDHRIRLCQENNNKNLYSWSLQEVSESGGRIGLDQVPWRWSLYFSASELRYTRKMEIQREGDSGDILRIPEKVASAESISGVLYSGRAAADSILDREVVYSMLGTNRQIEDINLTIQPLEKGNSNEVCAVWGSVSYTTEIDFQTETEGDTLHIYVGVSWERFTELRDLVNHVRPEIFFIRLGRVAGFYSEWSPSVTANRIKVLTEGSEHRVELPDGCEIDPPRLGVVGEFELTAMSRNSLKLKRDYDESGELDEFANERPDGFNESEQRHYALSEQLGKSQTALDKLRWPIWIIIILLLLLYLK